MFGLSGVSINIRGFCRYLHILGYVPRYRLLKNGTTKIDAEEFDASRPLNLVRELANKEHVLRLFSISLDRIVYGGEDIKSLPESATVDISIMRA